ncbi:hypothetical protein RHS01_02116 [Rhizoctonia solani]|uniref:Uncharacterized protein n=1 Tax=Rhizoctonia solani TaxID=456999 RepID=A0A8H7IKJ6_9AGAM|nr:hypothetical protein RHS01_02116 [Rhizoctonia solani]
MSSSGAIGSRWSRGSNASTHTIIQPPPARMARLNPVLTPLRTATGSKPSTPSSGRSTLHQPTRGRKTRRTKRRGGPTGGKVEGIAQKKWGAGTLDSRGPTSHPHFDYDLPNPTRVAVGISDSVTVGLASSNARYSFADGHHVRVPNAKILDDPTGTAMMADGGTPRRLLHPYSRARLPLRVTKRATSVGTHRSPSVVSEAQERGPVGRTRAHDAGSGQVSSASSFSDISGGFFLYDLGQDKKLIHLPDADMSSSALEDAMMSNNFASRMSMFSRAHHSRGARHGRFT